MSTIEERAIRMECRTFMLTPDLLLMHRPKEDEDQWYNVDLEEESCDCPYFQYNEGPCKHIIRAIIDKLKGEVIDVQS